MYGAKEAKTVNFFVPFVIDENEITDLSYMLSDSSALRALFNTNGKVDSEKTKYTSELRYDNRTVSLINLANEFIKVKKVSYIDPTIAIETGYIYSWSLFNYKTAVEEKKDEYAELERSIVAKLADDIIVGVRGKNVEIVVKKSFGPVYDFINRK